MQRSVSVGIGRKNRRHYSNTTCATRVVFSEPDNVFLPIDAEYLNKTH